MQRAQVILAAAKGLNNSAISQEVDLHRHQVRLWRQRWQAAKVQLDTLEVEGISDAVLIQQITASLNDEPRPGGPSRFSVEQIVQIVAEASEPTACSNRPVSHWTPRELASVVVKRGIVETISARSVGRFLKGSQESNHIRIATG